MTKNRVRFHGQDYSTLPQWLEANWGARAEFDNGCIVFLEEDVHMVWGTGPYGVDWGCNYEEGWKADVQQWLEYWDEDRTETGALIDPDKQAMPSLSVGDNDELRY